jgi:putative hemolysin
LGFKLNNNPKERLQVEILVSLLPWLIAMGVLIGCSAFFSASEAALFFLPSRERRAFETGTAAQRAATQLLSDPERLLSAVLFWNLVVNILYFALVSIVGLWLGQQDESGTQAIVFTCGALLVIIFFSEMLPKSVALLSPKSISQVVALPMVVAVRIVDPMMPAVKLVNLLSRRLLYPKFEPEPYLEVADLERAIQLSTEDADLAEREEATLQSIVGLSEIRVDELMRPRMQFRSFRPPVKLADLAGELPRSGYLLVTEHDSDEVEAAIDLSEVFDLPEEHLEYIAEPVVYVPWSMTVAAALEQLRSRDREVAAVMNELGETIGILTMHDILDSIFTVGASRSARLLNHSPITPLKSGVWQVAGMTNLRTLSRYFEMQLPETHAATVLGVLQEVLQQMPKVGDVCQWGPFRLCVIEAPERGQLQLELSMVRQEDES